MSNSLIKSYEVTPVQKAFISHIGLKNNKEYETWADEIAKELILYFYNEYEDITIEIPKLREKSEKSILGKLKNLQIERLSKLYALEGIPNEKKDELYLLIEERINENEKLNKINVLEKIKEIIYSEFKPENLNEIEQTIMVDGISKSTKTALLRILLTKVVKSDLPIEYRRNVFKHFEYMYGSIAARKTGSPDDDILRISSIISTKRDKNKLQRLRDEEKFLKANDLRGMKIVVVDFSNTMPTSNAKLKNIQTQRNIQTSQKEEDLLKQMGIVEIGKEFFSKIEQNEELLNRLHIKVIPSSSKHKKKENGYEAEHIKFISTDNPEFTLELQFKSEYVENMCKGEGKASHENRPGKARILPHCKTDKEFVRKMNYMVPKYKTLKRNGNNIEIQKYSILKNVMAYFQGQIPPDSEEYEKIIQVLSDKEQEEVK